ncbi:MAG: hypothetical protein ABEK17_04305 [Candidatus Aenigmatarchaeota archaeon]
MYFRSKKCEEMLNIDEKDKMNIKGVILTTTSFTYVMVLMTHMTLATTHIQTKIEINDGTGYMEQKINDKVLKISFNETNGTTIETNVNQTDVKYKLRSSGKGNVEVGSKIGEYSVNITSQTEEENLIGKNELNKTYNYFKSIFLHGWFKIKDILGA